MHLTAPPGQYMRLSFDDQNSEIWLKLNRGIMCEFRRTFGVCFRERKTNRQEYKALCQFYHNASKQPGKLIFGVIMWKLLF